MIAKDSERPCTKIGAGYEPPPRVPGFQHGFLNQVVGKIAIATQTAGKSSELRQDQREFPLECCVSQLVRSLGDLRCRHKTLRDDDVALCLITGWLTICSAGVGGRRPVRLCASRLSAMASRCEAHVYGAIGSCRASGRYPLI